MRKMKLNLEDIQVESFRTASAGSGRPGTVKAYATGSMDGCTAARGDCVKRDSVVQTCVNDGYCQQDPYDTATCGNTCTCHNLSLEFPDICGVISWPDCTAKCTNMLGCTTPDGGC